MESKCSGESHLFSLSWNTSAYSGEKSGNFFIHVRNQMLVEGNADQDGIYTFRRRLHLIERLPCEPMRCPALS